MCGFVGWFAYKNAIDRVLLEQARDRIRHRGPDDHGIYLSPDSGTGLGFRRLSIIDLSPNGHQPMQNEDSKVWILFNGEVYNYGEIRPALERNGHRFVSQTDTEVVLHAYEEWGSACLQKFVGMFAFVIWDARKDLVFAARDRLGIKPLYYAHQDEQLTVGSELKALTSLPTVTDGIDGAAVYDYLRYGYISAPKTIYNGIRHIPPGHYLTWDRAANRLELQAYWRPTEAFETRREAFLTGGQRSEASYVDELEALLCQSIKYRLISDVPLGAFLSGGIDSSVVVALMRQVSATDVNTYTIRFLDEAFNEADSAANVAAHLGTLHHEFTVTPDEVKAVIPRLPDFYDEPFSDKSALATYLVCKLAREHVTVALSGDGGDELFAGYNSYLWPLRYGTRWQQMEPFRALINQLNETFWFGPKIHKRLSVYGASSPSVMFSNRMSLWQDYEIGRLSPAALTAAQDQAYAEPRRAGLMDQCMLFDLQRYLPNDILTKVDRVSMAEALEVRVPILDHNVVEFALGLPIDYKVRNGTRKYLLRQVLARHVPTKLIDRPKQGFSVPLESWLRGDLRYLIDRYLSPDALSVPGLLSADSVAQTAQRYLDGRDPYTKVWNLLVLQMWLIETGSKVSVKSV